MIPLYSAQQIRDADNFAINSLGMPSIILMENAARSIYENVILNLSEKIEFKNVGILCGKGNNGGDGFATARHFLNNGYRVIIVSLGTEEELKGDALVNFRILSNIISFYPESKIIFYESVKDLSDLYTCDLIIDAMLGTGSRGELSEPYKSIVDKVNEIDCYKIAVDLPTGLDLEYAWGETIFNADLTITLAELKNGLFYSKGYKHSGEIVKGSIGIGKKYFEQLSVSEYLIEPEDAYFGIPQRELDDYKYSAGKVFVIAGSANLPGASFFTANSALKAGAGACFLAFPNSIKVLAQEKLEGAIVLPYNDNSKGYLSIDNCDEIREKIIWSDVTAIGPGLGREKETQEAVLKILSENKNTTFIIDADAIYALGNNNFKEISLKGKVLTPHHKEFASMLGVDLTKLNKEQMSIGKNFAIETGCYLVLKGAPTIIFTPEGDALINTTGNPGMAKFGSGDVLVGIIAGFLAQANNLEDALISAVYLHSLSADILLEEKTELGITPNDIMENFPNAIKFIRNSFIQSY
ncbi:NAD(P)H-hydrate dehydratase [Melioribacteraceae bacterium 4301-Me]|uniref:NAD(P)H-hydrate dehydratase n=1 Tax=Pyranulibacter aquaticus TaxID=3163344 RepID=UPI00359AEEE0